MATRGPRLRRPATRFGLVATLVLGLTLALAGPAAAAATTTGGSPFGPIRNAGWQSSNWAGYIVEDGPYTSVSGQWTVPSVSVTQPGFSAVWLGIDGVSSSNLIQVGTEQDSYFGRTSYSAWWEILPAPAVEITSLHIRPGDKITASIRHVSGATWRITIAAAGRGSYATVRTYRGKGTSAEWIVEAPVVGSHQTSLAKHAPVTFDHLTVNGRNPRLTTSESGVLIQFRRPVVSTSAPDPQRDGFTVRRI